MPLDGDSDRRRANWASEVRVLLVDPISGASEERVLSQGQLVTALRMGEEHWLDPDTDPPVFPRTARELHGNLAQAQAAAAARAASGGHRSGCQFLLVVDLASDASQAKAALVEERLAAAGPIEVADLNPEEAGIEEPEAYHPTLVVRVFTLPRRDVERVEAELRSCLYQGGVSAPRPSDADAGADADSTAGEASPATRFSLGRHGLLVSL